MCLDLFSNYLVAHRTNIGRELVYPWFELTLVSISVFTAVVIALLLTTRRALKSDLAMVLKGE